MEPRQCLRGNRPAFQDKSRSTAAGLLQWSHGVTAVETLRNMFPASKRHMRSRFNGATTLSPWKRHTIGPGPPSADPTNLTRFNGATTLSPWKPRQGDIQKHGLKARHPPLNALPGWRCNPLQWSHDVIAVETPGSLCPSQAHVAKHNFNGATTLSPWKRDAKRQCWCQSPWSPHHNHPKGFNGATALPPWKPPSNPCNLPAPRNTPASMEPRRYRRGNQMKKDTPRGDGCRVYVFCRRCAGFNGATTLSPWKPRAARLPEADECASMEPRHCCRGKESGGVRETCRLTSMEPRRYRRGNEN